MVRQFERLIDLGIGIKRQQEILHQKIERCARYRQTSDLNPHQMHGSLAVRRLNAGPGRHQLFALNQLSHQKIGPDSSGVAHLEEIDQRGGARLTVSQHQLRLSKSIVDDGGSLGSYPGIQLGFSESKHRAGLGLAALDEIQLPADADRHRVGRRKQRAAQRDEKQNPRYQIPSYLPARIEPEAAKIEPEDTR